MNEEKNNKGPKPKQLYSWTNLEDSCKESKEAAIMYLASKGSTQQECADFVGVSQSAISRFYRKAFTKGRYHLAQNVRDWQIEKAREGDTSLLIHLGKIYCDDQRDNAGPELEAGLLEQNIVQRCKDPVDPRDKV